MSVALLAEGVDRNVSVWSRTFHVFVALLAEGVDRNSPIVFWYGCSLVALLAEGVDRNLHGIGAVLCPAGRPPRGGRG